MFHFQKILFLRIIYNQNINLIKNWICDKCQMAERTWFLEVASRIKNEKALHLSDWSMTQHKIVHDTVYHDI